MAASPSCQVFPWALLRSLAIAESRDSRMQLRQSSVLQRLLLLLFGVIVAAASLAPAHAACEFVIVKQQIDTILDRDAETAAKFRREVTSGSDSIAVLESLVSSQMCEKIDICRFETAEYLTKRGFPPFH
jgi:hypothetical protein